MGRKKMETSEKVEDDGLVMGMSISDSLTRPLTRTEETKLANIPNIRGKLVGSGHKRGRKKLPVVEQKGWGIINRDASYLLEMFFKRKTDAINYLETTERTPYMQVKQKGTYVPVRITIIVNDGDLVKSSC